MAAGGQHTPGSAAFWELIRRFSQMDVDFERGSFQRKGAEAQGRREGVLLVVNLRSDALRLCIFAPWR